MKPANQRTQSALPRSKCVISKSTGLSFPLEAFFGCPDPQFGLQKPVTTLETTPLVSPLEARQMHRPLWSPPGLQVGGSGCLPGNRYAQPLG